MATEIIIKILTKIDLTLGTFRGILNKWIDKLKEEQRIEN
mgnify:FL=1